MIFKNTADFIFSNSIHLLDKAFNNFKRLQEMLSFGSTFHFFRTNPSPLGSLNMSNNLKQNIMVTLLKRILPTRSIHVYIDR